MKGNQKIIDMLNSLLTNELSAADQYFIHSRMYEDWGSLQKNWNTQPRWCNASCFWKAHPMWLHGKS